MSEFKEIRLEKLGSGLFAIPHEDENHNFLLVHQADIGFVLDFLLRWYTNEVDIWVEEKYGIAAKERREDV